MEVRSLPDAPGVSRTFGDKILFRSETVCVYEEILGPAQVRPMHSHAPRLIVPLTGAHAAQRFPSGEAREDRFPAGGAHWAPQVDGPRDPQHRHRALLGDRRRARLIRLSDGRAVNVARVSVALDRGARVSIRS